MDATKTAYFVKDLDGWRGDAKLYRLDPPFAGDHEYVIVSAAMAPFSGPETYIFPAHSSGECKSFLDMDGSYRGGLSHERALRNAGYEVATTH